ncbi:hypothetical protein [Nostoc sp. MG11]|uniref:hypothetical protein n=1 Tax=Nostoc sp. MG11 TaxID=2721166 RepID=UPI00186762DD|nr:hypothetical protein [Nostoc sp. MG11]
MEERTTLSTTLPKDLLLELPNSSAYHSRGVYANAFVICHNKRTVTLLQENIGNKISLNCKLLMAMVVICGDTLP